MSKSEHTTNFFLRDGIGETTVICPECFEIMNGVAVVKKPLFLSEGMFFDPDEMMPSYHERYQKMWRQIAGAANFLKDPSTKFNQLRDGMKHAAVLLYVNGIRLMNALPEDTRIALPPEIGMSPNRTSPKYLQIPGAPCPVRFNSWDVPPSISANEVEWYGEPHHYADFTLSLQRMTEGAKQHTFPVRFEVETALLA